ncbi:MAG: MMPL family transporter [Micromonosporaceae bacterium]|nr:MMPL family transporter [Micromonosporaceae bacterium]
MSALLYRLGRRAVRARLSVLAVWILLLGVTAAGCLLLTRGTDDTFTIPGSQTQEAFNHLRRVFPEVSGTSAQIVIVVPEGQRIDTPGIRAVTSETVARIGALDQVATVIDPFDGIMTGVVSANGRAAIITVQLTAGLTDVTPETRTDLLQVSEDLQRDLGNGIEVHAGGEAFSNRFPTFGLTEGIGILLALLILLVVFRSLLTAGMPLLTAMIGVGLSACLIYLATVVVPVSSTAPMLAVMIGLAVGIDYALLLLCRHRDQLADGLGTEESIARATATAGSAVVFAGLTVIIALLSLAVVRIPFLTTMGVAAALAVGAAVIVAVTLIPALLAMAGERLRPGRKAPAVRRRQGQLGRRWIRLVTRIPAATVVVVVAGLAVCTIPAGDLRLALPDNGTEARGTTARDTYDLISEYFGPGYNGPLLVTVDVITSTDPIGVVNAIADEIRRMPGVAFVPLATPNPKADTGIVEIIPTTSPESAETAQLVRALRQQQRHFRDTYGAQTAVTGITAGTIDVSTRLQDALLPFGTLVVGLSLLLMTMVFRSIWVPLTAAAGYLLSVGAAFGATSFIFCSGHLTGLLKVSHTGSVISFLPIVLMGVLFGLAMDYQVFLVSRIREEYVRDGDPYQAVEQGFVSACQVVTAAAAIMFSVFAAFVPDSTATIKPIAVSLAVGVFVDAFLVRMTMVPAVLALLGRRAWSLPAWLDRKLPLVDLEGDALVRELRLVDWPFPGCDEAISARDLRVDDDRGQPVFAGVNLRLCRGEILTVSGAGPAGKSALLFTIAGRVRRLTGDLKVLGQVLPQHAHAVRRQVALICCHQVPDPADHLAAALAEGVELLLLDDVDLIVSPHARAALRSVLSEHATNGARRTISGARRTTCVLTCQDTASIADLLPLDATSALALGGQPVLACQAGAVSPAPLPRQASETLQTVEVHSW